MKHDDLSTRMKEFYEQRSQTYLTRRIPVIIRIDGRSFHNFCKRFEKPYDKFLNDILNNVLSYLCKNIQGVKIGQRHSDEMSLLLTDYDTLQTECFFDYNVQKMCSLIASMASVEFCKLLTISQYKYEHPLNVLEEIEMKNVTNPFLTIQEDWPTFDCRCFNIPKEEIENYFYWRLLDCKRSSINMMAQSLFSHSKLQNKTCNEMQEMMFQEKGINWDKMPQEQKSGTICLKGQVEKPVEKGPRKGEIVSRTVWMVRPGPKTKTELDEIVKNISFCEIPEI